MRIRRYRQAPVLFFQKTYKYNAEFNLQMQQNSD